MFNNIPIFVNEIFNHWVLGVELCHHHWWGGFWHCLVSVGTSMV